MSKTTTFWVDSANNSLASGWNGLVYVNPPKFNYGDKVQLLVHNIKRPKMFESAMEEIPFPQNSTLSLAIGKLGKRPNGGYFTLTLGSHTTDYLDFDITAEELEHQLNSTSSFAMAGGVVVTQVNGDIFKIAFRNAGARGDVTGSGVMLTPECDVTVTRSQVGDEETQEVILVKMRQKPLVLQSVWADEEPCEAAVEQLTGNIWDIYLTSVPKDGNFSVQVDTDTPVTLSVYSTEKGVSEALGGAFRVTKQGDYRWRLQSVSEAVYTLSITDSSIISFGGKTATIDLTNPAIQEMLSGFNYDSATLELSLTDNDTGDTATLLNIPCIITDTVAR